MRCLPKQIHSNIRISGELQTWSKQLIEAQRRMISRYVEKKNEEQDTSFQDLANMFVDLRILNSREKYKREETRIHYDHLQLLMDIEACPKISVKDLFEAERPGMPTPTRSLVCGKPGIGKSVLSLHVLDLWLRNELLPNAVDQVFHFHMGDLSARKMCSVEDLLFGCQRNGKPSPDAVLKFFARLQSDPSKYIIIFDGLDETKVAPTEDRAFAYNEQVEMPCLIASILNGHTIPSVRLLVTSRLGGVPNYDAYDKKAELYGFSRDKISDYIVKFSAHNSRVQTSIEKYIDDNVNICSFCYIPAHLILVCRIVKARLERESNPDLPETLTELFVASIKNVLVNQYPKFKGSNADHTVDVVAKLKGPVLDHAKLARYGMEQDQVKVTFTKKEICRCHLEHVVTKCGLVSESRESGAVETTPSSTFSFLHLTTQEFLAAVALVIDIKRVKRMTTTALNRQLDLVLIFLAGLLGNSKNHQFLSSLHSRWWQSCQRSLRQNSAKSLKELMTSVVARERNNEANSEDESAAHKASTLLLVTMIYESRHSELWRCVSDYVLKDGTELDMTDQHLSPSEQHALTYVLPQTGLTSLM